MRLMKVIIVISAMLLLGMIHTSYVFPQDVQNVDKMDADEALEQELKWLKAETFVFTASRVMEEIKKAPASITVITDRQLRQMGALNFQDALSRIAPSFYTIYAWVGLYRPFVRGKHRVLLMINSQPIYQVNSQGEYQFVFDTLPVDNIKRIEVIRGPGSALYGANAYHGVINIITKGAEDVDGVELTALGGSWDTQQYNLLYGKSFSDLEVAFNFNHFKTNGHRAFIKEDLQSFIDRVWAPYLNSAGIPPASLAPGRTRGGDEKYDVALNLKFKEFTFDGRYIDREIESPFTLRPVLSEKAVSLIEEYYLNLSYEKAIRQGLSFSIKAYRTFQDYANDMQLFPPGFIAMTPNPAPPPNLIPAIWPEGLVDKLTFKDSRTGIDIQTTYQINNSNTIVVGATYEEQKEYDYDKWSNFLSTDDPNVLIQLPSVLKWPDDLTASAYPDYKNNYIAFFLEDIWDITQNIRLTTGVRYDHYDDFGGHYSPRAGLTWEYIDGYDLKLLYGHAFLIPTYHQIFERAPGTTLDPQTVDTYEISLGAKFTSSFNGRITFYRMDENDLIVDPTGNWAFINRGTAKTQGFEVEAKYDFGRGTYLAGNYTYMDLENSGSSDSYYFGKLVSNIRLSRHFNLYADCQHIDGLNRWGPEDLRDDTSGATFVNTTLIARKFLKDFDGLELRGSVYNLFDEDYSHYVSGLPYGWPQPGRNYVLEMKYSF